MTLLILQRFGGIGCLMVFAVLFMPKLEGIIINELNMIIFCLINIFGNFIAAYLIQQYSRKKFLILSSILCAISQAGGAFYYFMEDYDKNIADQIVFLSYTSFYLFGISFSLGTGIYLYFFNINYQ